jgi:hypothetical protein
VRSIRSPSEKGWEVLQPPRLSGAAQIEEPRKAQQFEAHAAARAWVKHDDMTMDERLDGLANLVDSLIR